MGVGSIEFGSALIRLYTGFYNYTQTRKFPHYCNKLTKLQFSIKQELFTAVMAIKACQAQVCGLPCIHKLVWSDLLAHP